MGWLDKFKQKPLPSNEEMLQRLDEAQAWADDVLLRAIPGSKEHTIIEHYKKMIAAIQTLVNLHIRDGIDVPVAMRKHIRDMKVQKLFTTSPPN